MYLDTGQRNSGVRGSVTFLTLRAALKNRLATAVAGLSSARHEGRGATELATLPQFPHKRVGIDSTQHAYLAITAELTLH